MSELNKVFKVIVIVWLSVLTLVWAVIVVKWQDVCDKVALTVLEDMVGGGRREVTYYQPKPWEQLSHTEKVEKVRAGQKRSTYQQRLDEAIKEADRKAREWHPELFKDSEPNKE